MAKVILENWEDGMEKVALTKLQMERLNLSLKESKGNVDSLLEGGKVELQIDNIITARIFFEEATSIGVICKIVS